MWARLRELGEALKARYGVSLLAGHVKADENTERALDGDEGTFWSGAEGSHAGVLEVRLRKAVTFDHALTMEWLVEGQAIQQYRIEAWVGGKWTTLVAGYAVGHKKIDRFAAVTTDRVRLNIVASAGVARGEGVSGVCVGWEVVGAT